MKKLFISILLVAFATLIGCAGPNPIRQNPYTTNYATAADAYARTAVASITNGLATTNYVNVATNGLATAFANYASTNYVIAATNNLIITTNQIDATFYNLVTNIGSASGTPDALTNNEARSTVFAADVSVGRQVNGDSSGANLFVGNDIYLWNGNDDAWVQTFSMGDYELNVLATYGLTANKLVGAHYGFGAGLTNIHGSNSIAEGTISTNRMDATAYAAFIGGGTPNALTNNNATAVTLADNLTVSGGLLTLGAGSAQNTLAASAALVTVSASITANGSNIRGRTIIGTNFVGNGASLTNIHGSNSIAAGTIDTNRMDATAYAAFIGGGDALTNNETRAVTFQSTLTLDTLIAFSNNIGSGAFTVSPYGDVTFRDGNSVGRGVGWNVSGFYGNGASLTNIHGSNSIAAGTISTNRMDATAYAAFIGGGTNFSGIYVTNNAFIGNSLAQGYSPNASGNYSHAQGNQTAASGNYSHAEGLVTTASGEGSHAEGVLTVATNQGAHAEGRLTTASGEGSHAEGLGTIASGDYSHAEGGNTTASNDYSHAEGFLTTAGGSGSHAEGYQTTASTNYSHAEGGNTTASGEISHAEGFQTTASGPYSHAEGWLTIASGEGSHAQGLQTVASGDYSQASGRYANATNSHTWVWNGDATAFGSTMSNQFSVYALNGIRLLGSPIYGDGSGLSNISALDLSGFGTAAYSNAAAFRLIGDTNFSGIYVTNNAFIGNNVTIGNSLAQGYSPDASGSGSHAEGYNTIALGDYSHAEGSFTLASNSYSHAEGENSIASGIGSHAEGYYSLASGFDAHAEGFYSIASGNYSHAEGYITTASGESSHAEGIGTVASGEGSHAEGIDTTASGDYSHAGGRGATAGHDTTWVWSSSAAPSFASTAPAQFSVYAAGGIRLIGSAISGNGSGLTNLTLSNMAGLGTAAYSNSTAFRLISNDNFTNIYVTNRLVVGAFASAPGLYAFAQGESATAVGVNSHAEGYNTYAYGLNAHAEGNATAAYGSHSHAQGEGTIADGNYSHAEGYQSKATNVASHAEGVGTLASNYASHAEGYQTTASGRSSHAEGESTIASGDYSHAEGVGGGGTGALGLASHAEGTQTTASGNYSHAEGIETVASGLASHAQGYQTLAQGIYSHAAGNDAEAINNYSWVWASGLSNGVAFQDTAASQFAVYATGGIRLIGSPIYGDGSGLSNVTATATPYTNDTGLPGVVNGYSIGTNLSTLATVTQLSSATNAATITASINATNVVVANLSNGLYTVSGNGAGLTNLNFSAGNYATNSSALTNVIDMTKPYSAATVNNTLTLTGLSGVSAFATNVQWAVRFYTNTSVSAKAVNFPASWIGNTVGQYITNQSVISIVIYPGFGTNVVYRNLK